MHKAISYFIILLTLSLAACKKDEPEAYSLKGKWLLVNGEVYAENMDKGGVMYYDHFSPTKQNSAMDLSGANLPIDYITQNKTMWEFEEEFKLNDSLSYDIAYERYSVRIYGLENGSARVLMIDNISKDFVQFTTGERRQAINNTNIAYLSKLSFKRIE